MTQNPVPPAAMLVTTVDSTALDRLIGYNAKQVSQRVMHAVEIRLQPFDLQGPIDYAVLNLIGHNAGITASQLCCALSIYPANMVAIVKCMENAHLVLKQQHLTDRRAHSLYLTQSGYALQATVDLVVAEADADVTAALTASERQLLNNLLHRTYVTDFDIRSEPQGCA